LKKLYVLFIIGICMLNFNFILAECVGEREFSSKTKLYINSKENIDNIEDDRIKDKLNIIREYENYRDIEIFKYLKHREYAIAFSGENFQNFAIIFRIDNSDFIASNYYENKKFDKENIQGVTTYYNIIGREFAYTYVDNLLYLSNNINIFFDIMNNVSYPKNNLQKNEFYNKYKPESDDYKYFYYIDEGGIIKNYDYNSKIIIISENKNEVIYSTNNPEINVDSKTYNFSDFIPNKIEEIYYGRDMGIVIKDLKEKYSYIVDKDSIHLKNNNLFIDDIVVKVGINEDESYILIYSAYNKNNLIEKVRKIYENEFFYNRKLNFETDENGVRYLNIPLFDKKIYVEYIKPNYLIITENKNIYDNIVMEKYYNYDYSYLSNKKEYYENYLTGEKNIFEIGNDYIREIF